MKKILVFMSAVAAFCSCSDNQYSNEPTVNEPTVMMTLTNNLDTRAVFDDTATPEPWESEIHSLMVVCYHGDERILVRELTDQELQSRKAVFTLPKSTGGSHCRFYVIANKDYDIQNSEQGDLLGSLESKSLDYYNGHYRDVAHGRKYDEGFVMTGYGEFLIESSRITPVTIPLKRVVAKIAVQVDLAEGFQSLYEGGFAVTRAAIHSDWDCSNLFETAPQLGSEHKNPYSITQVPGGTDVFYNLFYLYEQPAVVAEGDYACIDLDVVFYREADRSGESIKTTYTIPIEGSGKGRIARNGYYRLNCAIKGTGNSEIDFSITVADWQTPVTQQVDLGI